MNKKTIWQIVFEFMSIVFAVLLALGLNSYKQHQDLKQESELLTGKIITECIGNKERIDSVILNNQKMLDLLDSIMGEETVSGFDFEIDDDILLSSAWSFTQSSQAFQIMDSEFLDDATAVYQIQSYYSSISNQLITSFGEVVIHADDVKPKTLVRTCHYYLSNILEASIELQTYYRDFLDKHGSPAAIEANDE